jgi:3-oxoacyl-[acyl-carrier protein] reductase
MKAFDVVVGGSGDIGLSMVMNFLKRGRNVLYTYHTNSDVIDVVTKANVFGCEAIALKLDTTSQNDIQDLSVYIQSNQISVNNLVYNVGKTRDQLFKSMTEQDFMDVLNTNLIGCFRICKVLINSIVVNRGSIILISSISGMSARIGQVNYSCSKAALIALGRNLAAEYAKLGLRVNSIAPGYIKTKMLDHFSDEKMKEIIKEIPMRKIGTVEDISNLVYFLTSNESRYITGQTFVVDGGILMR